MPKPFKFRYVHEITGFFILICLTLFVLGIFYAARIQGWFEPKIEYRTVFSTTEGSYGLQKGAEVQILNTVAGNVTSILPNEAGSIEAVFELKKAFQKFVRVDSVAMVKKKFGVAGDAFLEIKTGNSRKPILASGTLIPSAKDTEIMETVENMMEDFRVKFLPAIEKLQVVLEELPELAGQVHATFREAEGFLKEFRQSAVPALNDARTVFQKLPETLAVLETTLTRLQSQIQDVRDAAVPALHEVKGAMVDVQDIRDAAVPAIHGIRDTVGKISELVKVLRETIDRFQEREMNQLIDELPDLGYKLEKTLDEAEKVLEGAQKHWLLRKYVDRDTPQAETIPPLDMGIKDSEHAP